MNEPLSYFVKYKEAVDNTTLDVARSVLTNNISSALGIIAGHSVETDNALTKQKDKIQQELDKLDTMVDNFKVDIEQELRKKETSYLSKSYTLYETANESPEYILDRKKEHPIVTDGNIKKKLIHVISENCTWQYPGVIVRSFEDDLISPMISLDPLYIMDEDLKLLEETKTKWTPEYQSRVRYSIINDADEVIYKKIPQAQIGFVLATDFFNYKPLGVIQKHTAEIYNLLRPGGVLLFTYNDCNLANGVRNFEKILYSYTPKSLVIPMLELIGFELVSSFSDANFNTNWIEVKKPGTRTTLRGGQTLGKIVV
jgi:hypothetical protein